jgi:nucleoside phosphorylase
VFVCAGSFETFSFARPVGIGMTACAVNLTRLLLRTSPKELIFVGTAGSYGTHDMFDIVESRAAARIEPSAFEGGAYTPLKPYTFFKNERYETAPFDADVSRETPIVNSSDYITTDRGVWDAMRARGIVLENMEFYAVMETARSFGIPAHGIFIVTNLCDENAHRDFLANHTEAMKRLTSYVITRYTDTKE